MNQKNEQTTNTTIPGIDASNGSSRNFRDIFSSSTNEKKVESVVMTEPVIMNEPDLKTNNTSMDKNLSVESEKPIPIIHLDALETDPYLNIPMSDMKKLFDTNNVLPVPVHGITISINLTEFQKLSDANPDSLNTINALSASLEEALTVEEVIKIRDRQVFSYKTGSTVMEDTFSGMDTASLQIITPDLSRNIKIEDVNVEDFDFDDMTTLIHVKEDCQDKTAGLSTILKKSTVVTILNLIQKQGPEKEFMFYANLIDQMKDSNSAKLALYQMRLLMQYALNTDTVLLQSVLTKMVLNDGGLNG